MKTTKILSAVSAAALLGISSVALAQGTGGGASPGSSEGAGGTTMQRQQGTSGSTAPSAQSPSRMDKSGSTSGDRMSPSQAQKDQGRSGQKANQAQQQGKEMGKDAQKSTQTQQRKDTQKSTTQMQGKDTQKSTTQRGQMGKDTQQTQRPGADSKSQMSREGAKEGAKGTVGAAPSGSINLSTEQRTTIRSEVLTERAPRVDSVNFSVNVGTVVPRSVRVVEVPPAIVKVRPAWRGYRYFVYNDEIVIVEPRTLKIVAVLEI